MRILCLFLALAFLFGCTRVPFEYTGADGSHIKGSWLTIGTNRTLEITIPCADGVTTGGGTVVLRYSTSPDSESVALLKTLSVMGISLSAKGAFLP